MKEEVEKEILEDLEKLHLCIDEFMVKNRFTVSTLTISRGVGMKEGVEYGYIYLEAKLSDGSIIFSRKKIDERCLNHKK